MKPSSFLRLALRIRPKRCASWRREPKWDEIWMRHVASGKSIDVSPTLDKKIVLTVQIYISHKRQARCTRIVLLTEGIVLEILKNSHSLDLSSPTMNVCLLELLCICFQCIDIVREDNNLVASRFMIIDQELARLIFVRIHAVQKHSLP